MTDNFEKKVAVDGPVVMRASLSRPRFPQARLCRQARWDMASDGRWRASVRSFRGFCVTRRCNFCRASLGVEIFRLEQWREKAIGGIDASLKQRKGDPVQAELDSAMKRDRRVDHAGGTAGGQDGDLRPLGRRRSRR